MAFHSVFIHTDIFQRIFQVPVFWQNLMDKKKDFGGEISPSKFDENGDEGNFLSKIDETRHFGKGKKFPNI